MKIRLKHTLGFALAVAAAIGFGYLAQLAFNMSFENSDPPYWTSYGTYLRVFSILGLPVIIGSTFERRAWLFGALAAVVFICYFEWTVLIARLPGDGAVPAAFWREACFEVLSYGALSALIAALVGWGRFKWYPRSRFGTIKLRLILVFFAFVFVGGNLFIKGMHGLYNEYRLSTAGISGEVTRLFEAWPGGIDAVYFKEALGEEVVIEMPDSPERVERFKHGEELFIRYAPDFDRRVERFLFYIPGDVYVFRWAEEDNTPSILSQSGLAFFGLVSVGLGMLFWRRVSKLSTHAA